MQEYLTFAKHLAHKAGDTMLHYFNTAVVSREKSDRTLVTAADEEINAMVIEEITRTYPNHSVFGEEASSALGHEYTWICDPVDGTVPFSKGLPVSVFSLALTRNGEPLVGVVYDPYLRRMYSAIKGGGAFLNDSPIQVNNAEIGRHTIVNVEWWPEAGYDIAPALHTLSLETKTYILTLGSVASASCYVASGKYGACVFGGSGRNVDIAAVKVIVEEAGGKVTDLFGKEQRYDRDIRGAIVSNGVVHADLVQALASLTK